MSTIEDEGADFVASFSEMFGGRQRLETRAKAERRAGQTKKQRQKAPPKTQKNFRASAETVAQLKALGRKLGIPETQVIEQAIAAFAIQKKV